MKLAILKFMRNKLQEQDKGQDLNKLRWVFKTITLGAPTYNV